MNRTFKIYIDYFNNFLSVNACAEYWGISASSMKRIVRFYRNKCDLKTGELGRLGKTFKLKD